MKKFLIWFFSIWMFMGVSHSQSQDDFPEVTLENPRNTAYIHLFYLQRDSYDPARAAQAMPPTMEEENRITLAEQLFQVYDGKGLFVTIDRIPDNSEYADSTGANVYVPFPRQLPGVYLERIDSLWYYSPQSIPVIRETHESLYPFGADLWINLLPFGTEGEYFGLQMWQYTAIFITLIIILLLHFLLSRFFRPVVSNFIYKRVRRLELEAKLVKQISRVISLLLVLYVLKILLPTLLLPIAAAEFLVKGVGIAQTVFIGVLLFRGVEVSSAYFKMVSERTETKMDKQALPIIDKVLKFFVILAVLFHVLSQLNVNVTALLAGISIGGLALALAAQDTIKNFIGSVMIFIDKPFQVGDFIHVDTYYGTVVEVGFRSTRLMLISTSIVTIPNGRMSDMDVTNLGRRIMRMLETKIALTYDTPPERIEIFMEGLKKLIWDHPKMVNENFIIKFFEMADYSLNIFIRGFIDVPDYATELRVKEEFFLSAMRLAKTVGVRFAFPSSTLYIEDFPEKKSRIPTYSKATEEVKDDMMAYLAKNEELMERFKQEYEEIERQKELEKAMQDEPKKPESR
jgi:MscS family membrane protein